MLVAQPSMFTFRRAIFIALVIVAIFIIQASATAALQTSLELTVTADQSSVVAGQSVNYRISVINAGVDTAERINVVPFLPIQFVYANGAIPRFLSDLGSLAPGGKIQQDILARIPSDTKAGRYTFTVMARATNADLVQKKVSVDIKTPRVLGASDSVMKQNYDIFIYLGLALIVLANLLTWIKLRPARKTREI